MAEVVVQRLIKKVKNELEVGIKYYSVLSALNSWKLTKRQTELLAFTSIRGTITPLAARQEFVKIFKSSMHSLENIKGKLIAKGLIVEDGDMYRVHPAIALDFSKDIILKITIKEDKDVNTKR